MTPSFASADALTGVLPNVFRVAGPSPVPRAFSTVS